MAEKSDQDNGCALIVALVVILISTPFVVAWKGFVLSKLWGWLIVSAFSVAPITVGTAIGIMTVHWFLVYPIHTNSDSEDDLVKQLARYFARSFLTPAYYLAFGWVVKQAFIYGWLSN